jgi:O-antigen ligase
MGIIAVVITYTVYFVYLKFGTVATVVYMGISGVAGAIFFLLIILGIGTETFIPSGGLSGRIPLWRGSVATFFEHPFIGIGIHNVGETIAAYTDANSLAPQNSYLRVFVAGGLIGGITYLWIVVSSTFKYIQKIESRADLLTFCLLIAFILIQFTDTAHPFGVNKNALIFGVTLGYIIDRVYNTKNN